MTELAQATQQRRRVSEGQATFPPQLAAASEEIDRLIDVAQKRGHMISPRETPWSFLERIVVEARTRSEIAHNKAIRRRHKRKLRMQGART